MATDRDIGVAVLGAWTGVVGRPLTGWEMLAATGIRGLRLAHETTAFSELLLTELHPTAFRVLERNATAVGGRKVRVARWDARFVPSSPSSFDYVDVDPFGTPTPFLGPALQMLSPGGLLAVTATDMPVLTGVERGACERRYGSRPIRGRLGPEAGLRILLARLAAEARPRSRSIAPVLCYVRDHYVRAYVRVVDGDPSTDSLRQVRRIPSGGWTGPRLPPDGPYGPLWVGPLFDRSVVERLEGLDQMTDDSLRMLPRFREESRADAPFFYEPNELASDLGLARPPALGPLLEAIERLGHPAARSLVRPSAFRTPCPRDTVEELARRVSDGAQSQNARVRA